MAFSSTQIHREIVARIAAADGSHYGRNVRRKIGFSPRRTPLGPRRKEGYKWNTTRGCSSSFECPGTRCTDTHTIASLCTRPPCISYERTTWYVYTVDYIINVVTALRLFAPRDEPRREPANIPPGDSTGGVDVYVCVHVRISAGYFPDFLPSKGSFNEGHVTVTTRVITPRLCVLSIQLYIIVYTLLNNFSRQ